MHISLSNHNHQQTNTPHTTQKPTHREKPIQKPTPITVDGTFDPNGRVQIRRIKQANGHWQSTEQGRQWADETGRHILIMLHGRAHQLTLSTETLQWQLQELHSGQTAL